MKALLLALLAANLAFFAWTQWLAPSDAARAASPLLQAPRLRLASEAAEAAQGDTSASAATATRCVTIGPFRDEPEAARAATLLGENALAARSRTATQQVLEDYWVSVGGFASARELTSALRNLQRSGLPDARAMPAAEGDRRISVGTFTARDRAENTAERVRRLGLEPQLAERTRSETAYWVDLELDANAANLSPQDLRPEGSEGGSQLRIEPCPQPQAGAGEAPRSTEAPGSGVGSSAEPAAAAAG
jgi:hypothetical protein